MKPLKREFLGFTEVDFVEVTGLGNGRHTSTRCYAALRAGRSRYPGDWKRQKSADLAH